LPWVRVVDDDGLPVQCEVDIAKVGRRFKTRILKLEVLRHLSDNRPGSIRVLFSKEVDGVLGKSEDLPEPRHLRIQGSQHTGL
jgi:hypothetical protein